MPRRGGDIAPPRGEGYGELMEGSSQSRALKELTERIDPSYAGN
jgi:hypothetical protein